MTDVPGAGFRLKQPNCGVHSRLAPVQLAAEVPLTRAGRAAALPVWLGSRPVVMLYGVPLCTITNGLMENWNGRGRLGPMTKGGRRSGHHDGPHPARRLYGSAGVPSASVLPYERL